MGFGTTIVLITVVICVSILFGMYMVLCFENEIAIFKNPRYRQRISDLEDQIQILKEKIYTEK